METAPKTRLNRAIRISKDEFENSLWNDQKTVVGIDEVGRGCLAGPLVVGAAILPIGITSPLLKDSKVLDHNEREAAYVWIQEHALFQAAILHNRFIDQHDIYQSTLMGMKKALVNLLSIAPQRPGAILVDAMPLTLAETGITDIPIYFFNKGESLSSSIAAASIVAKVTRDRLMGHYATLFPGYTLEQHKGYATKDHQDALIIQRQTIIHRTTFLRTLLAPKESHESTHQQSIC